MEKDMDQGTSGSAKRRELEAVGVKALEASKTELYIAMRFMGAALMSLRYEMDLSTVTVGTDAVNIRYNPSYILKLFVEEPGKLNRTYLHMILHCIFRHMYTSAFYEDERLFDLCADIVVESILDGMDYPCIYRVTSDYRDRMYALLEDELKVLTVEKLYRFFSAEGKELSIDELERAEREFKLDDHSFFRRIPKDEPEKENDEDEKLKEKLISPLVLREIKDKEKDWEKEAKRLQSEIDALSSRASDKVGKLSFLLQIQNTSRTDYREFLKRFMILREEGGIDLDSFDYGMYSFGMTHYGNMPLIEENEFREVKRLKELVIAVDTSASCTDTLLEGFLREAAKILLDKESFFQKIKVHLIECDDRVQKDELIESVEDMERRIGKITVEGGFGTDFRPVFEYVENLREKGEFENLKGLIYFTDGYGEYPKKSPDYDVAFAFPKDGDIDDTKVPEWALKLYV